MIHDMRIWSAAIMLIVFLLAIANPPGAQARDVQTSPDPDVYLDRSGINELIFSNVIYGAALGWMTGRFIMGESANQSDPNDPYDESQPTYVRDFGGALFGAGSGVALSLLLTRNKPVLSGDVVFTNWAGRIGLANGVIIPFLFMDWSTTDWNTARVPLGVGIGLSAGAYTASWLLIDKLRPSPGYGSAIGSGFKWGYILGNLAFLTFNPPTYNQTDREAKSQLGWPLLLGDIGTTAAAVYFAKRKVSRSRIIWTDVGGTIGAGAGFGLGYLLFGSDPQTATGMSMVGILGGLTLGYILSAGTEDWKKSAPVSELSSLVTVHDGEYTVGILLPRLGPVITPEGYVEKNSLRISANLLDIVW